MHLIGDTLTFSLFDSHDLYPSSLMSSVIEENSMLHEPGLSFNDTTMNSDYIIQDLEPKPERWDSGDLMQWIMNTCSDHSRDYEDINLHRFRHFTSADIPNITENDFLNAVKNRNYNLGRWLYTKLRQLFDAPTTERYENMLRFSPPCDSVNRIDCVSQSSGSDGEAEPVVQKRQRGRPKSSNKARRKSEHKTGKLWEFLRDLLLNPDYCPSIICWENYEEGVFKFVSSEKVAKLWGSKRGNNVMNYEKLSRAMRYYYKTQVLAPVIGKRLVYRFGINAKGWHTDNPNFLKSNSYTSKL